eukprot:2951693-Pleurochrysis_carterae.AAC.1
MYDTSSDEEVEELFEDRKRARKAPTAVSGNKQGEGMSKWRNDYNKRSRWWTILEDREIRNPDSYE